MKTIIKLLLTITLSLVFSGNMLFSTLSEGTKQQMDARWAQLEYDYNYEATIEYIKTHEGYAGNSYICPGGYVTIGYGHVVKDNEEFQEPISKEQADRLLRKDFNLALKLVEDNMQLSGNKKLAIAHFVFAKGIGAFLRSELKKKIELGIEINDELLKHCYFTTGEGKTIKSAYMYNIRMWELELFYK